MSHREGTAGTAITLYHILSLDTDLPMTTAHGSFFLLQLVMNTNCVLFYNGPHGYFRMEQSGVHPGDRHDKWEGHLPTDVNVMWERFKHSPSFSESKDNVDLRHLYSLIQHPVLHLVQDLKQRRQERNLLEQPLLETRREPRSSAKQSTEGATGLYKLTTGQILFVCL